MLSTFYQMIIKHVLRWDLLQPQAASTYPNAFRLSRSLARFVIGKKHKLIPSVYGLCDIAPKDGKATYSGEIFIRIRSGKHDTSSAYTHAYDVRELFNSNLIERKPVLRVLMELQMKHRDTLKY